MKTRTPTQPAADRSIQPLTGVWVQRVGSRTFLIWDPSKSDDVSRRAWLGMTQELIRRRKMEATK